MPKSMPAMPKYWPDDDARTLARAKEIQADPKRMKSAVKAAGSMAQEQMQQAKAIKQIANKKIK